MRTQINKNKPVKWTISNRYPSLEQIILISCKTELCIKLWKSSLQSLTVEIYTLKKIKILVLNYYFSLKYKF